MSKDKRIISGQKYFWEITPSNNRLSANIAMQYNIGIPVAEVLITRGYNTPERIEDFLFLHEQNNVFHPSLLADGLKAVERIRQAITTKEKILISGDYDVDGITASSLMMACLLPLGADVNFFLPNRAIHGYGLSPSTIKKAASSGYSVIITVDNGITAHEAALEAKKSNIDLIITDHHKPHSGLPEAYAIVNPQRSDCEYPFKQLAGVGVSFKLMSLLYEQEQKSLPKKAYELLLLGTIADVVPLTRENRYFVRYGLQHVNKEPSKSLTVLKTNGNVQKEKLSSIDIGFSITPQINALGRLEDPREAVRFLIGTDKNHIDRVGKILLELNETRKLLERGFVQEVEQKIAQKIINIQEDMVIVDANKLFPIGVIGLIASRLTSTYARPAIIFSVSDNGIAKGSCRSTPHVNVFDMLESVSDLLIKFGGHAQAAGLSLDVANIPLFKKRIKDYLVKHNIQYQEKITVTVDAELPLSDVNHKLISDLHYLEPFGHHNDIPVFFIHSLSLLYPPKLLKEVHVKIQVFTEGIMRDVIFFNRPDLFSFFTHLDGQEFAILGRTTVNEWNGKTSVELVGVDVCLKKEYEMYI